MSDPVYGRLPGVGRGREVPVVVPAQFVVGTESPLEILRRQLAALEPSSGHADPSAHV